MAMYQYEIGTVDHRDANGRLQSTEYIQKMTRTWDDDGAAIVFGDKYGTKLYNHAKLNEFVRTLNNAQVGYFFRLILNVNRRSEICRYDERAQRLTPLRSEREIQDYLGMTKSPWYTFRKILKEKHIYEEIPHCSGRRYILNPVYAVESHNRMTEEMAFAFGQEIAPYLSPRKRELVYGLCGESSAPVETTDDDAEIIVAQPKRDDEHQRIMRGMEQQMQHEKELLDQFRYSVDLDKVRAKKSIHWLNDWMDDVIGA